MKWTCTNCDHTNKQTDLRCSKCLGSKYAHNTLNVLADQSGPPLTTAVAVPNGSEAKSAEVRRVGAREVPSLPGSLPGSLPRAAVCPAVLISEKTAQGDIGVGTERMLQVEGEEVELPTALPAPKTKYDAGDHHYLTSMILNALTIAALVLSVQLFSTNQIEWLFVFSCGSLLFFYILYLWHGIFMASDLEYLTNCVDTSEYFKLLSRHKPTLIMYAHLFSASVQNCPRQHELLPHWQSCNES